MSARLIVVQERQGFTSRMPVLPKERRKLALKCSAFSGGDVTTYYWSASLPAIKYQHEQERTLELLDDQSRTILPTCDRQPFVPFFPRSLHH